MPGRRRDFECLDVTRTFVCPDADGNLNAWTYPGLLIGLALGTCKYTFISFSLELCLQAWRLGSLAKVPLEAVDALV